MNFLKPILTTLFLTPLAALHAANKPNKDLGKLRFPNVDSQTSWITARALDFLDRRDKAKPFFRFVSYLDPHSPSHLCEPYWSMHRNEYNPERIPLPPTFRHDPTKPLATDANRHEVNDPNIVKAMTAAYYAKVSMVEYDLAKDPQETHNLAADPACAETVTTLAAQLDAWQKDSPPVPVIDGVAPEP